MHVIVVIWAPITNIQARIIYEDIFLALQMPCWLHANKTIDKM